MTPSYQITEESYNKLFRRGKIRITHLVTVSGIIAVTLNFVVYRESFSPGLRILEASIMSVFVVSYALFLLKRIRYQIQFLILSWTIILALITAHLVYYPKIEQFIPHLDYFFLRGLICIVIVLPLTGVICRRKDLVMQSLACLAYIMIYSFYHHSPFAQENISLLATMLVGYLIAILFFITNMHFFIRGNKYFRTTLQIKNKELEDNMAYAQKIGKAVLSPEHVIASLCAEAMVIFQPQQTVFSDFYWATETEGAVVLALGDFQGGRVSGAMTSVICTDIMRRAIAQVPHETPGSILEATYSTLASGLPSGFAESLHHLNITVCNLRHHQLQCSGINRPVWVVSTRSDRDQPQQGSAVHHGLIELNPVVDNQDTVDHGGSIATHSMDLNEGDCIYIFSQGVIDLLVSDSEVDRTKELQDLLVHIFPLPLQDQKPVLEKRISAWAEENTPTSDLCLIGVRV